MNRLVALGVVAFTGIGCGSTTRAGGPQGPRLSVSPAARLDLGSTQPGAQLSATLTITNSGTEPLLFGASGNQPPQLAGAAAADFTISWPSSLRTAGLAPGASLAVAVQFLAGDSGPRTAALLFATNDPAASTTQVDLVAFVTGCQWIADPPAVDFGLLAVRAYSGQTLTLRNISQDSGQLCTFSGFALDDGTGATPTAFGFGKRPPTAPLALAAGEGYSLLLNAAVPDIGPHHAALTFEVQGAIPTKKSIPVQAVGDPCIQVPLTVLDFGPVITACDSKRQHTKVDIGTRCSAALVITRVTLDGEPGPFAITMPTHLTATPGAPVHVAVDFLPTRAGSFTARVVALTSTKEHVVVELRGTSTDPAMLREEYEQPALMDVLAVVDDSCSMFDKQTKLGSEFTSLTTALTARAFDARIAVASYAYPPNSGCSVRWTWGTGIPANDTAIVPCDHTGMLDDAIQVVAGLRGQGFFVRDPAALAVLIITDGGDAAASLAPSYATRLLGMKRLSDLYFAAEVPTSKIAPLPSSSCTYDTEKGFDASLEIEVARRVGGVAEDICSDGSRIRGFLSDARRVFLLSQPANTARTPALEVTLDGSPLPATGNGGATNWTFDAATRWLQVDPSVAMPIGSKLAVSYDPACE